MNRTLFTHIKKMTSVIMTAVLTVSLVTSCGRAGESDVEADVPEDDGVSIGMTFDSFVTERWLKDRDIFVTTAGAGGATVNVQTANADVDEQKRQMEYFIEEGVDVIVVIPVDSDSLSEEVKKAKDKGIKVIAYDRMLNDSDEDLYISFNNESVGRFMAEEMIKALPKGGRIVKINGPLKDNNVSLVNKGFDKAITGHGITVVDEFYCDKWIGEEAFEYMASHPDLARTADAFMCGNDDLAGNTIKYLSEMKRAGKVPVVGQDADLEACQRIVAGTQTMTVYKPIEVLASKAAELAIDMAEGRELENVTTMNDGTYNVPYYNVEPVMVDVHNLDSVIIDSGFHMRDDVYLLKEG
ncbi:MAG: substrate-binding domain-containing protein [Lachnospiraceae bacterium]|nr:substrate-binding domain-containing protein [Lachnospiraceae bacterium]